VREASGLRGRAAMAVGGAIVCTGLLAVVATAILTLELPRQPGDARADRRRGQSTVANTASAVGGTVRQVAEGTQGMARDLITDVHYQPLRVGEGF
jgi:hypothetical protein